MPFNAGDIVEGKVASIAKFGAFVTLPDESTGLVHISEIANTFVNDIHDHLQVGQTVKVKVVTVGEDGKVSLSIKKALPAPERRPTLERRPAPERRPGPGSDSRSRTEPESFEDKLSRFMHESNSNLSGHFNNKRTRRRGSGRD